MLTNDESSIARNGDRHNHIGIRLQYRNGDKWEHCEALGWNEVGFNFYHAREMPEPRLELRRGLQRFDGTIVWRSRSASDEVLAAMVINELIFKRAKEVVNDAGLYARLIKLIRVSGMVPEKLKILESLGGGASSAKMAELINHKKQEPPMFHYGVKVQSEAWSEVVKSALSVSSVLVSMEKWSEGFGKPAAS